MKISLKLYKALDSIYGYTIVNSDPLNKSSLENSKITMYGVNTGFQTKLFKTKKERDKFIKKENPKVQLTYQYDYLGNVAGKNNVIKEKDEYGSSRLIAVDGNYNNSYYVYNYKKSKEIGEYSWNHYYDEFNEKYIICQTLLENIQEKEEEQTKKKIK